jgi:hypothetical protein
MTQSSLVNEEVSQESGLLDNASPEVEAQEANPTKNRNITS